MYFLTTAEGGRKTNLVPQNTRDNSVWMNTQVINKNAWSVGLYFKPNTIVIPGSTHDVEVAFLVKEAYNVFVSGTELHYCEGQKVVAKGKIYE